MLTSGVHSVPENNEMFQNEPEGTGNAEAGPRGRKRARGDEDVEEGYHPAKKPRIRP